ncbi:D-serine deaminase, pyridoxal phosphate-dependent [Geodermatophilus amargosae]|uniref:D-serine deaminase, pyridoxal phosphate-dependent n=1 Tax=Geodermatophilus amargosae TaxID=1296565 RepID=A0A1I7AZ19_9ACTN|nr:amino acid deaminase/aldolase [Geodermatophilus amargosae]SFT80190.1 D-serine deaminase, pyridoxal phosphate-dependent [Geodermatophilus amargosae]
MTSARARLDAATADLDPPLAVLDLDALDANAADLTRRAGGRPIRVASKSVRSRAVLRRVLARPGFAGVLAYTLAEALWLAGGDDPVCEDVVVGYPSVDRTALRRLLADPALAARVTLMVDSPDHLDAVDAVARPGTRRPVRVCLDLDASLRAAGGRVHVGVRRSPVHDPAGAAALARAVCDRRGFTLVGLMAYEAQVAGVPDAPPGRPLRGLAVRGVQALSVRELAARRAAAVAAVSAVAPLEFVNGGGTGSLERTAADAAVTELAAGSGLYQPTLFDGYRAFRGRPALLFALPVTRRPAPRTVTVAGGGWIASGPPGADRLPRPVHPPRLRLLGTEGAGEVQTPLRGPDADGLRVGDRVWFRHAKAGEVCEHVDVLHTLDGDALPGAVPTYRGEGRAF